MSKGGVVVTFSDLKPYLCATCMAALAETRYPCAEEGHCAPCASYQGVPMVIPTLIREAWEQSRQPGQEDKSDE